MLTGENDFALTKKIVQLKAQFDGTTERYEAADLSAERLADIFAGQTLFALKRLVIIDTPSASPELWQHLPEWSKRLSDDTQLVLVEPRLDKRTSVYKWLQKNVEVEYFAALDERNHTSVAEWLADYAKAKGVRLSHQHSRRLIERGGTDQWALAQAVDKLALVDEITDQWIDDVIDSSPSENVFSLFETALNAQPERVQTMLEGLRQTEDAYRVLGLISAQAVQLVTLVYGQGDAAKVAADTGAKSTYPYQKLAPYAARITRQQAAQFIKILAEADMRLKSSDANPWTVLESSLVQLASR